MFNIFGLDVSKISVITSEETPAVPKATTKFSFFKTWKKKKINTESLEKLQKKLNLE